MMVTGLRQAISRLNEKGARQAWSVLFATAVVTAACSNEEDARVDPRADAGLQDTGSDHQQQPDGDPDGQASPDAPEDRSLFDIVEDRAPDADAGMEADGGDDCPIVDGGCSDGCVPAYGRPYDSGAECLGPKQLLVCFDQWETPPAQALPFEAPDGTCWMVYPPCYKLVEIGWDMSGTCDMAAMQGADPCP